MKKPVLSLALLILLLAPLAAFSQDITLHATSTSAGMGGRGDRNTTETTYMSAKAIKHSSSDGNDAIVRLDQGKIITVNHPKKTYSEMTFQQLNDMLNKMTAELGKNQEQMEAMRKMMGQMAASFALTKVGPGETIAGYATVKYLIKGPMDMEIWAAPDLKVPATYYDALKAQAPRNPMFDMTKLYDEMKKIDGMTLKQIMTMKMMNMEMKTTRVVTSVDKGAIPASTFEVPAGYKLEPLKLDQH